MQSRIDTHHQSWGPLVYSRTCHTSLRDRYRVSSNQSTGQSRFPSRQSGLWATSLWLASPLLHTLAVGPSDLPTPGPYPLRTRDLVFPIRYYTWLAHTGIICLWLLWSCFMSFPSNEALYIYICIQHRKRIKLQSTFSFIKKREKEEIPVNWKEVKKIS